MKEILKSHHIFYKSSHKSGISLIVLMITIVVVIILSAIVILAIANNNPFDAAHEAVFKGDLDNFRSELAIYHSGKYVNSSGMYNQTSLQASSEAIGDIIKSLKNNKKYEGKLYIEKGKLIFICTGTREDEWAEEIGIAVKCIEPEITISNPEPAVINSQNDVKYTAFVVSNYPITDVVEEKIRLYRQRQGEEEQDIEVENSLLFSYIDEIGENENYRKLVEITVETENLADGNYYVKILTDAVKTQVNEKEVTNKEELISDTFEVNNVVPQAPDILPSTAYPTNQDVLVTIKYNGEDGNTRKYRIGENEWIESDEKEVVLNIAENTLIIAKEINSLGTESSSSLTLDNIDKIPPVVALTGMEATSSNITVQAIATDTGTAGIDESSYQYSKDNGLTWLEPTNQTTYTFSNLATGAYNLKVKVKDRAGNEAVSISTLTMSTQALGAITIVPSITALTNQNVIVTISYPQEIVTKQYRIEGGTWAEYIDVLTITSNTIVYARGFDSASNQTDQATLEISNIDKIPPNVPTVKYNGGANTCSWKNNYNLTLTSTDNIAIAKYQLDWNNDGVVDYDIGNNFIPWNGYSSCTSRFRAVDSAGNVSGWTGEHHIHMDTQLPTYSSYEVKNITSNGYDIYVYGVADSVSGINRLQFPTWTEYNGQDDLIPDWPINVASSGQNLGNGTWYFRVNISEHNNENGIYVTHVYLYDYAGNVVGFEANSSVNVPIPTNWQYYQAITTTTNWIVPVTGWYKIHAIGKGGNGGNGTNGGEWVRFLSEGDYYMYYYASPGGGGGGSGGLAISQLYLYAGTSIPIVVNDFQTVFNNTMVANAGNNGGNGKNGSKTLCYDSFQICVECLERRK